jgi:hypothetical protein
MITEIKTVKGIISNKIDNYRNHKQSVKGTIKALEEKQKKLSSTTEQPPELGNDLRKEVINELLQKDILKKFFDTLHDEQSYKKILKEIEDVVKEKFSKELPVIHEANKYHSVIWLRDDERPADTYSFYNSKNNDVTLYAKAGLNQRSYHLWANGNRDGDYVEVYYDHLNSMQEHSFFPHNDRRFCHITSDYLNDNSEAREYLRKREEIWKNIYNANSAINLHFIEKIFAFGYVLKTIDSTNEITLQINNTTSNFSVKLDCKIKLTKEELTKVLRKYGSFTVNDDIMFEIEFGETMAVKAKASGTASKVLTTAGVDAFYKLKEKIESKESQTTISELLKKHGSLITSDLSEEMLFRIFLDILLYKIDAKIKSFSKQTDMETFQKTIQPCITKLNKEVERLKKVDLDMNHEYVIINRMNAQLIEWHKLMDARMDSTKSDEKEKAVLTSRDL